jgi:hypothetical protein
MRLLLEPLEDRTLFAVLPTAVVTNPSTFLAGALSPDIIQDPANPLKMVAVATTGAGLVGEYSTDGGLTWNGFGVGVTLTDTTTGGGFGVVTNPTVAMDRYENLYVAAIERNAVAVNTVGSAGAVVFERWQFTGNTPTQNANEASADKYALGSAPVVGETGFPVGTGGAQWANSDPIDNVVVAVDPNATQFKDPITGAIVKDTMATSATDGFGANANGVDKGLYVA